MSNCLRIFSYHYLPSKALQICALTFAIIFCVKFSFAQGSSYYHLNTFNEPYQELTDETILNEGYTISPQMPVRTLHTPAFLIFDRAYTQFDICYSYIRFGGDNDAVKSYITFPQLLDDRGVYRSESKLSYSVEGATGAGIIKIQWKNAGILRQTQKIDSVNLQIWLHEASSCIEVRFGESSISYDDKLGLWLYSIIDTSQVMLNSTSIAGYPNQNYLDSTNFIWNTPMSGFSARLCHTALKRENLQPQTALSFYPNPSAGAVTIETNQSVHPTVITLYDNKGCVALTKQLVALTESFDISALPSGIYLLRAQNDGKTSFHKLAKQ